MKARRWIVAAALGATGVFGVIPAAQADPDIDLAARLHGSRYYPHAGGFSEYERGGGERSVEVTVRAPGAAHRYVVVFVNRHRVGRMHLNSHGYAHRDWETDHGQYVPFASVGDPVRVRRAGTSRLVVAGRYHWED